MLILQSNGWQGTGPTLASGLLACQSEWVLRADADDCSAPHRAERQLSYLLQNPDLTVLGCQLRESSGNNSIDSFRRVPQDPQKLRCLMNWWNPLNHPTVAFHREKILSAGSYRGILNFEDWDLWLRLSYRGVRWLIFPMYSLLPMLTMRTWHVDMDLNTRYENSNFFFVVEKGTHSWLVSVAFTVSEASFATSPRSVLASVMRLLQYFFH